MAILRLCSPSTTRFATCQFFFSTHDFSPIPQLKTTLFPPSASLSLSSPSTRITIKPQSSGLYRFHAVSAHSSIQTLEKDHELGEQEASGNRLLAQNVPWTCTADDLRPLFEKYGTVVEIELSMYNKTRNRGLAFVSMGSHEEALAAFNNLQSYEFEGRVLKLNWAKPKKEKPAPPPPKPVPIHNLFVANLSFKARAKDLREFFNADKGNVASAEVIFHENPRRSAGYGFVSFYTKEEAEVALAEFQGKEFMGRPIRVARSRRFLRPQTKANMESENAKDKLDSMEQTEKSDKV